MTEMLAVPPLLKAPRFELRFAETAAEIIATQKLRYRIFAGELGAQIDGGEAGIDRDHYDPHCRHLMVLDAETGEVVACTRILTGEAAEATGGFYSASEFDIAMLDALPGRLLEIGRTCVAPEHRNGAVIATLWQGIAGFITSAGYDYLFGCASIGLEDGGAAAQAMLETLRGKSMSSPGQRVRPYYPLPAADRRPSATRCPEGRVRMPPLLKAYLSLGAKVCGEPYWDRDFNCADVFMLLNVSDLNPRYARHFLGKSRSEVQIEHVPLA